MVMQVGKINHILFKGVQPSSSFAQTPQEKTQINTLTNVTPDFNVKIPARYADLGVQETSNGLKVYSYKLANGLKVTIVPMEGSPAVVKNYVNVGSLNETDDIKGISHFLEHMAFNGTNGSNGYIKLNQGDSFSKIDGMGGWTNASTNYAITDYVNSTPLLEKDDLKKQLQVISAMTEDLSLTDKMIEKEKGPVCSEINMIMDDPMTIAFDQTIRSLFNIKSSADELVAGSVKHIKALDRQKVKDYYDTYYTPDNMNLVITGDINPQETIEMVSKLFNSSKTRKGKIYEEQISPINSAIRKDFITDKANSTNVLIGFAGPKNKDVKARILYDVAKQYINSSSVGIPQELRKLNSNYEFGWDKISTNPNNPILIYSNINCVDDKSELAMKVIFDKLSNVEEPTHEELNNIKERLLQRYNDNTEYSLSVNEVVGRGVLDGSLDYLNKYKEILEEIKPDEVKEFIDTYINPNKAAISVVHPNVSEESILENYNKASNVSFKGRALNSEKVSTKTLDNNYLIASHDTKNQNVYFDINLRYNPPENINPAAIMVLNVMYNLGTAKKNELELTKFKEDNNLSIKVGVNKGNLSINGYSGKDKFKTTVNLANEILNSPRFDQETFNEAISMAKDALKVSSDGVDRLYADYEAKNNPFYTSKAELEEGLRNLTLDDVKAMHEYIKENSMGTIVFNTPDEDFKTIAEKAFSELNSVNNYQYKVNDVYKANEKPVVLIKAKEVSQAEIRQTYKFLVEDSIKERAVGEIMNIILSSSPSIGLFNTLREKEHLAYAVHSNINKCGNCGEVNLRILTTTDNKDIGEISYDNIQKSINGFYRQIGELLNSRYTDDDIESAKKQVKASLLNKEGTPAKLNTINSGLYSPYGIDCENKVLDSIDSITREDIDNFAKKVFNYPPIYSIVASKDTLNANQDYLNELKNQDNF